VTPIVSEGLPPLVLSACRVAGTPQAFADAVLRYLESTPEQRRALALAVDFRSLSWDRALAPVHEILAQAASRA
jgi:hypothetical protein